MFLRRAHRSGRLGRLKPGAPSSRRSRLCWLLVAALLAGGLSACASAPKPAPGAADARSAERHRESSRGFYHIVQRGQNLYRIGLRYGFSADQLMRVNRMNSSSELKAGMRLWIPGSGQTRKPEPDAFALAPPPGQRAAPPSPRKSSVSTDPVARKRHEVRRALAAATDLDFGWPIDQGRLASRYGRRWGRNHHGIDIAAPRGTHIEAAEDGHVVHAGRLGSYGKVVILSHAGRYRTLYAHANTTSVKKGQQVRKGQKIAEVGNTGNSTGPHLHFEIRAGERSKDPLLYLP